MRKDKTLLGGIALIAMFGASSLFAGPMDQVNHPHKDMAQLVHEAEHDVDQAWEVYHRAALGGTVASPALQAEIEDHLHEARTLVTQAREAAEQGDRELLEHLVGHVRTHTVQAIEGSQERKK